jgi:hypothetical protein
MLQKKDYLPGYTGFVAGKKDVYGCTTGETSRQLKHESYKYTNYTADNEAISGINRNKAYYSFKPAPVDQEMNTTLGNRSKEGATWIGGHTQMLKPQHIPGYKGHVPGIHSENLFSKTFGNSTSKIMAKEHTVGNNISNAERFTTSTQAEFSNKNFRRLANDEEPLMKKDKDDFEEYFSTMGIDPIELAKLPTETRAIDDLPTIGYSGHQSIYRNNLYKKFGNVNLLDISPLKAKLRSVSNVDMRSTQDYQGMSDNFKNIVDKNTDLTKKPIKLPAVGYTGHRPGNKAQNFYGKPFKECSMQSKWIENMRG